MFKRYPLRAWSLVAGAAFMIACSDAAEDARPAFEETSERAVPGDTAAGDSVLDAVPYFPADPERGAEAADGAGTTGATTGTARPAGPGGSSARDGGGPAGGDDLGGRRDVGSATDASQPSTPRTDEILARAARAYAGVRTLRADFRQTTQNPVLRRTTTSSGTIYQARPDRFAMRFSEPEGDRIVADGEYVWVYYPSIDAQQVIRMSASAGAGAVDLQAQFVGDPTERFAAEHEGVESVNGRPADVLTLTPRTRETYRTLKVWVDQRDALVRRFEITDHSGVVRAFVLTGLTPGADIDPAVFRFTPPDGAHVVARG